ncbi:LysR family transcriptional regulator ['Paenibacillus yunnanensis' Narsing Rao et al. 2020]|uniref:LysR family transcriptional regulator n=1 Tax=Paenibacillus tengchongensis TaxID=2608684 RepID=UPI00124C9927|nr:LysR family transcriptional regulator [Paenibacillus tengchongensis]
MNIVKLQIVVLIEKYKKVTDVAAELGLKQPTVSFHMKSLENELGVSLFQYRSGRVLLTDAGRALHQYAVRIVSLTAEAQRSVRQFSSLSSGHLELDAAYIPGTYIVPKITARYMNLHPGIQISLSVLSDHVVRERLRSREIQLAVLHGSENADETIHTLPICRDEIVLIFAPDHPFAGNDELTPEIVAREPWIRHDPTSFMRGYADRWAQQNQVRLWSNVVINSPEALKRMIGEGGCVGLFSRTGIASELAAGTLKCAALPGSPVESSQIFLAWRKDYTLTPLQEAFAALASEQESGPLNINPITN